MPPPGAKGPPGGFGPGGFGPGGAKGGAKAKGGKKGKGGFGGFGPPSDKAQLVTLVVKLEQLTDKPLTLTLTDAQRSAIREQLQDLSEQEEISDEDAKKRLDAILDSLKDQRPVLEAAGYRWPGTPFAFTPPPPGNPFKEGPDRDRLSALQENLAKKK